MEIPQTFIIIKILFFTWEQHILLDEIKKDFFVLEGDLITRLNIFNSFVLHHCQQEWCEKNMVNFYNLKRAVRIRNQLHGYLKMLNLPIETCEGK